MILKEKFYYSEIAYRYEIQEYTSEDPYEDWDGVIYDNDFIGFFAIKYEVLREIDYFDENVFLFYEEDILATKVKNLGYKIYSLNHVTFEHFESNSINKALSYYNKMKRLQASKMYYQKEYNEINNNFYIN